jgi:hypothetical protein
MRELSVAEQRYQAVLAVIGDGLSVSQVAEKVGVSRKGRPDSTSVRSKLRLVASPIQAHHRQRMKTRLGRGLLSASR